MKVKKEDLKYILGLCIIPMLIMYGFWRNYQVNHFTRYTIATTTRRIITTKNGPEIEFIYSVNQIEFKSYGYDVEKYHIQYPDKRYFVKYSYKNPSACEIQWNIPVPDSLMTAPSNGWEKIPILNKN